MPACRQAGQRLNVNCYFAVTFTAAVELFPVASSALAEIVYFLFFAPGTFHEQEYGAEVSVQVRVLPILNSTRKAPALSVAVAVIFCVERAATVDPAAGLVIE